jgi:hypothetical protein
MALVYKITYETPSIGFLFSNTEEKPSPADVPEDMWVATETAGPQDDMKVLFGELLQKESEGALIRNIKIFESDKTEPMYVDKTDENTP